MTIKYKMKKGLIRYETYIREHMIGTYGACAFMISHSLYLNKNCFMEKETGCKTD